MEEAEITQNEVVTQEPIQEKPVEHIQDKNWRAINQKLADMERNTAEKDALIRELLQQKNKEPEEPELPDDEYVNQGSAKRFARKAVEPIEKELQEVKSQLAYQKQQSMLSGLRQKYSDFDDVVNSETIAIFEEREPELASQIAEMKDPYRIGIQSYKYIKALNLASDVPSKRRQKEAEKMLDKNSKTMQSPQAFDKRPMAQAFRLSEADKSALYDEMMSYAAMASAVPETGN